MGIRIVLTAGITTALLIASGLTEHRLTATAAAMPSMPAAQDGLLLQIQGEENPASARLQRKRKAAQEAKRKHQEQKKAQAAQELRTAERAAAAAKSRARSEALQAQEAAELAHKAAREAKRAQARALREEQEAADEQGLFSIDGGDPEDAD